MTDIPKGWKLVPEHATEAMEAAALAGVQGLHGISDRDWRSKVPSDLFRLAWRHMLAAVEPFILPTDPSPGPHMGGRRYAPISDEQINDIVNCGDLSTARIKITRLIHNESGEPERFRRMVERRDAFIITNGLWDAFKEASREEG